MDFGDILDEWERETAKPYGKKKLADDARRAGEGRKGSRGAESGNERVEPGKERVNPMELWLRRNGIEDKDAAPETERESPADRRRRLRAMKPDATIDLHGLVRDEAWARLEAFFADAVRRGFEKVLIIHGKGTHSADDPVLGPLVRLFIERHPRAGESGHPARDAGGAGSTWVLLK